MVAFRDSISDEVSVTCSDKRFLTNAESTTGIAVSLQRYNRCVRPQNSLDFRRKKFE